MDGIQPYSGSLRSRTVQAAPTHPTLVKGPSDYLRALRRRIWLILAIGVPLSVTAAVLAVRQPAIYQARVEIKIEPPQYDPALMTLISHTIGSRDQDAQEKYVPNHAAQLKGRHLAEIVVNDPSVARPSVSTEDAVQDLVNAIQTRQIPNSNYFTVTLEGTDPARTQRLLYTLLDNFQKLAKDEVREKVEASKENALVSLNKLKDELATLDRDIDNVLKTTRTVGPGGKSIPEEQYNQINVMVAQKKSQYAQLQQQAFISQYFPSARGQFGGSPNDGQIAELERKREELVGRLHRIKRIARHFDTDPAARDTADKLSMITQRLDRLRGASASPDAGDPNEAILANLREEIRGDEERAERLLKMYQESMPEHQRFLTMLEERKEKKDEIATMQGKLRDFDTLANSQSQRSPIWVPPVIAEPTTPVRPRRALNIAIGIFFSFGLGIGLVCLLEYLDNSVKVPEHLTMGLRLPLFGVVPRIRRTALTHRGGHLWTPGAPDSIEADAYRNLRASLLGASDRRGPIVTLLVTSAKAGEGKSTTALNLAATCARAGERVLLMDVDLRRPSLNDVFGEGEHCVGLVDVLRGDLPWQRTVVRTDIPNLDFLPTGDTRDIPIEILGTLELRQLLIALSSHYDRVILDGPAILGLADCRMLGRIVDAALLVVRSGTHELRPLERAKAMLEQSHVVIAGVVFNALFEDLQNWSSYGPNMPYGLPESTGGADRAALGRPGGSDASSGEHAALPAAVGSYPS
jgi:capsular exopolysaccharide synthesis family protein